MALILANTSSNPMSSTAQSDIHIQSIGVKFKDERNKYPVSIEASFRENEVDKSRMYKKDEDVHWLCARRVASDSQLKIIVREHHRIYTSEKITVHVLVSKLHEKPFFEIGADGDPISIKIHSNSGGRFIDIVRRRVEQSQVELEEMKPFMEKLGKVCEALDYIITVTDAASSVHPAVESAASVLTSLLELCQQLKKCNTAACDLMEEVATFLPFADIPESGLKCEVTSQATTEMLLLFGEICGAISKYSNDYVLGGLLGDHLEDFGSFKKRLGRVKETFGWCVMTEIWKTTLNIGATADALLSEKLNPVKKASYREDKLCFTGSRRDTLQIIESWSESESSPPIFWLSGSSGMGKTRVAHTVAKRFDEQNRLAGQFIPVDPEYPYADSSETEPCSESVIPTIAYQMAKWHADYQTKICNFLLGSKELRLYSGLDVQFELLMKNPILSGNVRSPLRSPPNHKPLIVVLDAIEKYRDAPSCNRHFVDYVVKIATLVPWLKVFVTSGASKTIEHRLGTSGAVVQHLAIDNPTLDLHHDSVAYARLCEEHRSAPEEWTSGKLDDVRGLLSRISISCNTSTAFQSMEISGPITDFYVLARSVLERIRENDIPVARSVLSMVTCLISAKTPTEDVLFHFLHPSHPSVTRDYVHGIIVNLSPIIYSTREDTLYLLPPADIFSEYLSDHRESGHFYVDMESLKSEVAQCCLHSMHTKLKLNICGLDPRLRNEDVPDMKERIDMHISGILRYCTLHWIDLVAQSWNTKHHHEAVARFLGTYKVLFWLEVLSLLGELDAGRAALLKCADQFKKDSKIFWAVRELQTFISQFESVIRHSVPHLYIYAITWITPDSPVTNGVIHGSLSGRTIAFEGITKRMEKAVCIDSSDDIYCIARSPDESRIVSGSFNGALEIWDGWTGERLSGPSKGHTNWVNDVKYSPDGTKFFSGSDDKTVKIWDAWTGKLVQVLKSDSEVWTVACLLDGSRVASGHRDGRVRIWDAQKGTLVAQSQDRQWVYSATCSPDGLRIISGSYDGTLRIWDAESGTAVSQPLKAHGGDVKAVTYLLDGSRVVSGPGDKTNRIWDAHFGTPIGKPLEGHGNWVIDVGFSQDGIIPASGKTVRFWNAGDGTSVGVLRRGESRWDTGRRQFVSIPHWWPHSESVWRLFTTQALVYSANPIYIPDDGWIRTLDGNLFLWVPPEHRACSCHAASESTMTTNPLDGWLRDSAWAHIPQWADIKRMMTEQELKRD